MLRQFLYRDVTTLIQDFLSQVEGFSFDEERWRSSGAPRAQAGSAADGLADALNISDRRAKALVEKIREVVALHTG